CDVDGNVFESVSRHLLELRPRARLVAELRVEECKSAAPDREASIVLREVLDLVGNLFEAALRPAEPEHVHAEELKGVRLARALPEGKCLLGALFRLVESPLQEGAEHTHDRRPPEIVGLTEPLRQVREGLPLGFRVLDAAEFPEVAHTVSAAAKLG